MWALHSPARDGTCGPCIGRQNLNHWPTREVPLIHFQGRSLLLMKYEEQLVSAADKPTAKIADVIIVVLFLWPSDPVRTRKGDSETKKC